MRDKRTYAKIAVNLLLAVILILLLIFVVPRILSFFMPFVIGGIIALIANPLVKFLEQKVKIVRKHSTAIIIIVVLAGVVLLLYLLGSLLVHEVMNLIQNMPQLYDSIEGQLNLAADNLQGLYKNMPSGVKNFFDNFSDNISNLAQNAISNFEGPKFEDASRFAFSVVDGIFSFLITILSAYFFITERDNLVNGLTKIVPESIQERWILMTGYCKQAVGGYFKAQLKLMVLIAVILFVGLEILGIGYSFLLALAIAFLDFLPVFGTGAVLWPWALVDMITGHYVRAIGLLVIYLVCQVVKQVLQPKMVGDSIGLSPLFTLFVMYIGYKFSGVLGMIIAIPIGMIVVNFARAGMFDRLISNIRMIVHDINEFRKQ